jgi:hypothetical protein
MLTTASQLYNRKPDPHIAQGIVIVYISLVLWDGRIAGARRRGHNGAR